MATEPTTVNAPTPMLESPLPREVLAHLYGSMMKAQLLEKRLRKAAHTSEAILSGALQNAQAEDVIVSAQPHPVLEALLGADVSLLLRPKLETKKKTDMQAMDSKIVVAGPETAPAVAAGLGLALKRAQASGIAILILPGKNTKGAAWNQATTFAAEQRVPLVIIADWTESRTSRSHEGRDLSHWPFPTIAVDGRDVIGVYRVTKEAISSARKGHGPTLVDCVNFVAPGSRGKDGRDPLNSFRGYLKRHNAWSDEYNTLEANLSREIGEVKARR